VFERAFEDFGLPGTIRTDNGIPFACSQALFGLSKLSVWWLRLGIDIERIQPGQPQQNGRHEGQGAVDLHYAAGPRRPRYRGKEGHRRLRRRAVSCMRLR